MTDAAFRQQTDLEDKLQRILRVNLHRQPPIVTALLVAEVKQHLSAKLDSGTHTFICQALDEDD